MLSGILFLPFPGMRKVYSQEKQLYRIFFKDKGPEQFTPGSSLYEKTLSLFTDRALKRRIKYLRKDELISIQDAPVYKPYTDSLKSLGIIIHSRLRWFNYALVLADSAIIPELSKLDFVAKAEHSDTRFVPVPGIVSTKKNINNTLGEEPFVNCGGFDYGDSYPQNNILNLTSLHKYGVTGADVLVGITDTGFNRFLHNAFKFIHVTDEYDFIFNDSVTANQAIDTSVQQEHGTEVLSVLGGYDNGHLIGFCPSADFILSKTEYIRSETMSEEDFFAAALEWMESMGVDVVNTSLGYKNFNNPGSSHSAKDINGSSTLAARYVNEAARRGVLCVVSAGNKGPAPGTIQTPGDADSALTAGAVLINGLPAKFTSRGPLSNGLIKPNIAALGEQVISAPPFSANIYMQGAGTSFAAPAIAGSAALMLSLFPELKPDEIKRLLYESSSLYPYRDDTVGYGVPDVFSAAQKAGTIITPPAVFPVTIYQRIITHVISDDRPDVKLYIRFENGRDFHEFQMMPTNYEYQFAADIPLSMFGPIAAEYYILVNTTEDSRRLPYDESKYLDVDSGNVNIPCGLDKSMLSAWGLEKSHSFIYPSMVEDYRNYIQANIFISGPGTMEISLFSSDGRLINRTRVYKANPCIANSNINIQGLADGAYFLRVIHSGKSEIFPILINR